MKAQFFLKNLVLQNFATFRNQTISFKQGFNAIIGETGSGKSLVLDALQLILGGRADKKIVRRETEYSLIEASFYCKDEIVKKFLEAEGFPIADHEIIIKRLIYKNGLTKNYINHLTCTVTFLSSFSKKFIDVVGQFENQKLLSENYQLHLLDQYSKHLTDVQTYQEKLKKYKNDRKDFQDLSLSKSLREQRLDYLNFQLQEIEKLNPSSQDEEDLLLKKNLMMNLEKTQRLCYQAREHFDGSDGQMGIFDHLKTLGHLFHKNQDLFGEQTSLLTELEDGIHKLSQSVDLKLNLEVDPGELEVVLERLDTYQKLKKKFGNSVENILQTQGDFFREKNQLEQVDFNLEELKSTLAKSEAELLNLADHLHEQRKKNAKKLSLELTKNVQALKMTGATIKLCVEKQTELTETGLDKAYFIAETNPGEGFFKIKDIASGGELSRILLALRQILSNHDSISIFLFDEIDTGIGGETAITIGKALSEVAQNGQVIAITHLPQIAQFAESLVIVNKDIKAKNKEARTESTVKEVVGKLVLKEVREMSQLMQ